MKIETVPFRLFENVFHIPIFFHPSKNKFCLDLPGPLFTELFGEDAYPSQYSNTNYEELIREIKYLLKEREATKLEEFKEKIIIYEVDMDCCFEYRGKNGRKKELSVGSTHRGTGVKLKWRTAWKMTFGDTIKYKESDDRCEFHVGNEEKVIPWTEQRESFFNGIETKLNMICLQFNEFFKQREKKILATMDAGLLLEDKSQK